MKNETAKGSKSADKKAKSSDQDWFIPSLGMTVKASSLDEALRKANKTTQK